MANAKKSKGILGNENAAGLDIVNFETARKGVQLLLEGLGFNWKEDPNMRDTPTRVVNMYAREMFKGCYAASPVFTTFPNTKEVDELICIPNIAINSVCSHHLVSFSGVCHVGYIPSKDGRLCGLSKIARVVEWFARRPQIQEELTSQIADYLDRKLQPLGVMVVIDAKHGCMTTRGVMQPTASAVTSKVIGCFKNNPAARAEFLTFIRGKL